MRILWKRELNVVESSEGPTAFNIKLNNNEE